MTIRKPHNLVLGAVILAAFLLSRLPERWVSRAEFAIGGVYFPLFAVVGGGEEFAVSALESARSKEELVKQIASLRQENEQLKTERVWLEAISGEENELRRALDYKTRSPYQMVYGRIIGREPLSWWRNLRIDRGSVDGVEVGYPVVSEEGALGKVSAVGKHHCVVTLFGDPTMQFSAKIAETEEHGFVLPHSKGWFDVGYVEVSYLPPSGEFRVGNKVVTSGAGTIFPPNIPVGEVVDVREIGFGLYSTARVKLTVHSGKLNHVWIVKP